jgi:hypothetical protein
MKKEFSDEMGFTFRDTKQGEIVIFHHGKNVTTLRGNKAIEFREDVSSLDDDEQQQLMARLTGNHKRGNERSARKHERNERKNQQDE